MLCHMYVSAYVCVLNGAGPAAAAQVLMRADRQGVTEGTIIQEVCECGVSTAAVCEETHLWS